MGTRCGREPDASRSRPHDVELTPRQVVDLDRAKYVLYLSHGFQPAVEQAVRGAGGCKIDVLAGLPLRAGVGDEAGKTDPHVWLDPVLFARVVTRIGAALGAPRRAAALSLDSVVSTPPTEPVCAAAADANSSPAMPRSAI